MTGKTHRVKYSEELVQLPRLTSEKEAVLSPTAMYITALKEIARLRNGILAASHLLKAAHGPNGGPTSWTETRRRWMEEFETITKD